MFEALNDDILCAELEDAEGCGKRLHRYNLTGEQGTSSSSQHLITYLASNTK